MYVSPTNDRNTAIGSSPPMLTVRTPVRSTPRTHEATSAMSAVSTCTSSVTGSEMAGSPSTVNSPSSSSSPGSAVPAGPPDAGPPPWRPAAISHTCDGWAAARSTARCAPSAMSPRAASGCRLEAPNLVNDSLTTTRSASGRNGSASAIVCWSPVISPTGA
jgi:hypothetical protein